MLFLFCVFVALAVGGVLTYVAPRLAITDVRGQQCSITRLEFIVVAICISLIAMLVIVIFGPRAARAQAAGGYNEFFNGSIVKAYVDETKCSRDGPCRHEYDCDPYMVKVVDRQAYTDSKGFYHAEISHMETRYHECPYATKEFSYLLDDNIGRTLTIGNHWLDANPERYRSGRSIPSNIPRGIPERWQTSKQRLEQGDAEPVTRTNEYTNYLLASEQSLLKQYSDSIERYQKDGLLPEHTADLKKNVLFDHDMQARKAQFVGINGNTAEWHDRLMRFNAALGSERQGDLHLVALPAKRISNPDDYINALLAYWQSGLGKWGFPKNGIAVALGISDDGNTIEWARAKTGMPVGNGELTTAVALQLAGKPFTAETVLGTIKAQPVVKDKKPVVNYLHGNGLLDRIFFTEFPFKRACMKCGDKDDNGTSFVYLKDSVPVSTGAKVLWLFIVFLLAAMLWAGVFFFDPAASMRAIYTQGPVLRSKIRL